MPNFKIPFNHESQPHICQLAAILTDQNGKIKSELNAIIKPEGWEITNETSDIHGITQEDALKYGMLKKNVISIFGGMVMCADTIVAHNISFDKGMIERDSVKQLEFFPTNKKFFCTMKESALIIKAPLTEKQKAYGITGYKNLICRKHIRIFSGNHSRGRMMLWQMYGLARIYFSN